ncbi:hypothetical protein AVEN_133196-1 [Araneus ventricosus]|uniref:Uncharacterized protein n=1 Tax=Araneus ventricosus TaxID=182803 RepID=A0A4Y2U2Y2_ARAVE|nr:hypothetical protein AVEN_193705-1 [Araneus ventricosus]GBO06971.1 hypothetical protein AVEN_133196-1 [Araneus ventricosus]
MFVASHEDERGRGVVSHVLLQKKFLEKQHFPSDDDAQKTAVRARLCSPAANVFETGILKLVPRYDTGFNSYGSYMQGS